MAIALFNPCSPCCTPPFYCCPNPPTELCAILSNNSGCECLDGDVIPLLKVGETTWESDFLTVCPGGKKIKLVLVCQASAGTTNQCGQYRLAGYCSSLTINGPQIEPAYPVACTCSPFSLTYTGMTIQSGPSACCSGSFDVLIKSGCESCTLSNILVMTFHDVDGCSCLEGKSIYLVWDGSIWSTTGNVAELCNTNSSMNFQLSYGGSNASGYVLMGNCLPNEHLIVNEPPTVDFVCDPFYLLITFPSLSWVPGLDISCCNNPFGGHSFSATISL